LQADRGRQGQGKIDIEPGLLELWSEWLEFLRDKMLAWFW
jgi:hypothetical protein